MSETFEERNTRDARTLIAHETGLSVEATWELDGEIVTTEHPTKYVVVAGPDAVNATRGRGIPLSRLISFRDTYSDMLQQAHRRKDESAALPEAVKYLLEHHEELTPERAQVDESYYQALLDAVQHLDRLGVSNPLELIATNTGVRYPTLRTRYYAAKKKADRKRG